MNKKDVVYSIGIDQGVSSCGWSVIDEYGKLLKKGNTPLWGYSIFSEAETAKNRRLFRATRRRYTRRKQRIHLLQDLLSDIIYPVDDLFFKRLKFSYLVPEDRQDDLKTNSILLVGKYNDKQFYNDYPTIYHLRNTLCKSDKKADPRLIYLALHHIVKYRGNFLHENENLSGICNSSNIEKKLNQIFDSLEIYFQEINDIINILTNDDLQKKEKIKTVTYLFSNKEDAEIVKEIFNAILGYKFNLDKIFNCEIGKVAFSDTTFEDKEDEISNVLGDEIEIIYELEDIYSYFALKNIVKDPSRTLSSNMIDIYEFHNKDLICLKELLKSNKKIKKNVLGKNALYDKYINNPKEMPKEEFYKQLKKEIGGLKQSNEKAYILNRIDNDEFLLKQNSTDNGSIPYQMHYSEAELIIEKQSKYYPSLKENKDKILSLISFRRPYYLGPNKNATNSWMVLKDPKDYVIRPWNWEEKVNIDETASLFINRMRNHCTYILEEDTLPKNSILLNRFNVLNELNKIRLNGKYLINNRKLKDKLINDLFLKKNKITENDLKKWIIDNQLCNDYTIELTGFQSEKSFSSNLSAEIKFRKILGNDFDKNIDNVEKIIEYLTVYNNKDIIIKKIKEDIDFKFNDDQLKAILSCNFAGYGRLSRKLLDGLVSNSMSTHVGTIISIMYETNDNFMQVLSNSDYGFKEQISELNGNNVDDFTYENTVGKLVTSPANKRAIWMTMKVVKDIVKYMKHEPKAIYMEFAREEGEKARTESRYKKLERIFKEANNKKMLEILKDKKDDVSNDRLYLYLTQNCKCMYSGKTLDINKLHLYQVDHIIPQSYVKDDSLENKVLVISSENQRKSDSLLLDQDIIDRQKIEWKKLLDCNLIGPKKFSNLTRTTISEKEKVSFIERQLVETRQICVHVKDILRKQYTNSKVFSIHAGLSSDFRNKFELYKIRELNDVHHAQDAYLAALIGQIVYKKYPFILDEGKIVYKQIKKEIETSLQEENKKQKSEKRMYNFILNQLSNETMTDKNGEIVWRGENQIEYIKKIFYSKNYFYNYQTRDYDGALYKASLYSKGEGKIKIKNTMDVTKYGGYKELQIAYCLAIEYIEKQKTKKEIISIPAIYSNKPDCYIKDNLNIDNYKVISKLLKGQTFISNNCLYSLSSGEEWNIRQQLYLSENSIKVLHNIYKNDDNIKEKEIDLLYIELITKLYDYYPDLRSVIVRKIIGEVEGIDIHNRNIKQKLISNFHLVKLKERCDFIRNIINAKATHTILEFNGTKIADRFGRVRKNTTYYNQIALVYTSASGIYKTIV